MLPPSDGPIRVALIHDARVVHAGLRHLTGPYSDRVLLLPDDPTTAVNSAHLVMHGDLRPASFVRVTRSAMEIVYTTRPDPEDVRAAVQRGASGAACKDWTAFQLVAAIEQSVRGWRGDEGSPRRSLLPSVPDEGPETPLSPREVELLSLVAQGLSNEDIAEVMSVSVNSVKSYIRSAYRKIGVSRRTQAVLWALSHDLHAPGPTPVA